MKFLIGIVLIFVSLLFFMPQTGTSEIRNLPLLIFILLVFFVFFLIRFIKYRNLVSKIKRLLKKYELQLKTGKGIVFEKCGNVTQIIPIVCRNAKHRYHFESINLLEWYKSVATIYRHRGTNMFVETLKSGDKKLEWNSAVAIKIALFDKSPRVVTDSEKNVPLGAGERICDTDMYFYDLQGFEKYLKENI